MIMKRKIQIISPPNDQLTGVYTCPTIWQNSGDRYSDWYIRLEFLAILI